MLMLLPPTNNGLLLLFPLLLLAEWGHSSSSPSPSVGHHPPSSRGRRLEGPQPPTGTGTGTSSVRQYVLHAVPEHDAKMLRELTDYAVDYCHIIGNVAMWKDPPEPSDLAVVLPISLLPSPFPLELFEKAKRLQPLLNELYFRVSMDFDFILEAYEHLMEADPWIKRQVELMIRVKEAGIKQHKTLIVARADYLTHQTEESDPIEIKQVEVNISQLGGPGFGYNMSKTHRKMLQKIEHLHYGKLPSMEKAVVPEANSVPGMAEAMLLAWEAFVKQYDDEKAVIVFLTDPNIISVAHFEQIQFMQYKVEELAYGQGKYVNVERVTILESPNRIRIDESDHSLYLDGNKRVALVHMVVGLLTHHWPTEKEWNTRFDMERSTAILSPNIRAQLTGTKRMQQMLAQKGVIEHYLGKHYSEEQIKELRTTFMGLWGLEKQDAETEEIVQQAIEKPGNFVLKAQLGSGKGNYFNDEVKEMLETMDANERSAYTLMEKIKPIAVKNYMRRPFHSATLEDVNAEISIFGTYLGDGTLEASTMVFNRAAEYVCRSKLSHSDQGGISEGYGLFDSVLLFPMEQFMRKN